jgi:hypothetical protein
MKPDYYDHETIELTLTLRVSWKAGNEAAKAHAMEEAQDVFVGLKSGAHVDYGCYRVERV